MTKRSKTVPSSPGLPTGTKGGPRFNLELNTTQQISVPERERIVKILMPYKAKDIPRQAEVAQGVPGSLRPRIFSTFSTTRVIVSQPNTPAAFTPVEIPGTHFQRLSRPQGTWFCQKEPRKKSQVTPPGIDPGTVQLVAQRLNHYAPPGPADVLYWSNLKST